ncbi:MAG: hypothetical protein WBM97_15140, partial [Sedimenticolaceae bacterium]
RDMNKPKTLAETGWNQSLVELSVLYVLIAGATIHFLDVHAMIAMAISPVIMLALLLGVITFVEVSWRLVVGMDKVVNAVGLRKSPLT